MEDIASTHNTDDAPEEHTPEQAALIEIGQRMAGFVKKIIEGGEDFHPFMHAMTPDGVQVASVAALFVPGYEDVRPMVLRKFLAQVKATSYVLATESWTLPEAVTTKMAEQQGLRKKKKKEIELQRPIREDDRRISVISLTGEDKAGNVYFALFEIDEAHGRKIDVDKPMVLHCRAKSDTTGMGGRLSNLLGGVQ